MAVRRANQKDLAMLKQRVEKKADLKVRLYERSALYEGSALAYFAAAID
jgi:hypothetical protein